LNPKKFKNILDEITKDIDCDKQLVLDVMDFYWSSVRKSIITVDYPRITIESLGTFRLKPRVLQKTMLKYKIAMAGFKNPDFSKYLRYQNLKSRLEILERAAEQLKDEADRYKQLKTNRYGNIPRSMEEKGKDS
jgi:hypothetical protein